MVLVNSIDIYRGVPKNPYISSLALEAIHLSFNFCILSHQVPSRQLLHSNITFFFLFTPLILSYNGKPGQNSQ